MAARLGSVLWGVIALGAVACGRVDFEAISDGGASDASDAGCVRTLAAGEEHTCVLRTDGTIMCWGRNNRGQLGDGTVSRHAVPAPVLDTTGAPVTGFTQISLGTGHVSCGLSGGFGYCWGADEAGQLGTSSADTMDESHPTIVSTGVMGQFANIAQLIAGETHTCAVLTDASLWCWGDNTFNQLGREDATGALVPVPVETSSHAPVGDVHAAWVGEKVTCYADSSLAPQCWGTNAIGLLGECTDASHAHPAPVSVPSVTSGSASAYHSCAVTATGEVYCWGLADEGSLGNNVSAPGGTSRCDPQRVVDIGGAGASLQDVASVATGDKFTCALRRGGDVACWGRNVEGELGSTDYGASSLVPVSVALPLRAVQLAAGNSHACALLEDGQVYCWGANPSGELGRGTPGDSFATPAPTLGVCN